jgi:hypothetical protein
LPSPRPVGFTAYLPFVPARALSHTRNATPTATPRSTPRAASTRPRPTATPTPRARH